LFENFPKDVILYAVLFYVRYGVSYRDLEEIMEERVLSQELVKAKIALSSGITVVRGKYSCL
jgi:hypothetical protein